MIGAYGLDAAGQVANSLDRLTFGSISYINKGISQAGDLAATGIRRAVRYATGDASLAQEVGDYATFAAGLFLPGTAAKAAKLEQWARTAATLSSVSESAQKIHALDLAYKTHGKLKVRPGQEWKYKISGSAQKTGTPGHAFESVKEAIRMAQDPTIARVYLDRGYHRMLNDQGLSHIRLPHNRRPDVLGVSHDGRAVRATEVMSKSDRKYLLEGRNKTVRTQLKPHGITVEVDVKNIPTWDYVNKRPKQ